MTSYLDAFTYNNNNIVDIVIFPVGAIVPYLGTSEPTGWIFCNGVNRTSSDNRYAALAGILNINGVSSNTANSITPPNLQNKFLYGASTNSSVNNTGTNNTGNVTLVSDNLPSHTHTITFSSTSHSHNVPVSAGSAPFFSNSSPTGSLGTYGTGSRSATSRNNTKTGITANCGNTGIGTAFSILPPYATVNYIIKF
jgi:microcystin-dependent protein